MYFLYEIVHHCNLNCKSCDHFSPLADEEYVKLETYEKDINEMNKKFDRIANIGIMGGEPLLHPNLDKILEITRKILKKTNILVFTNGIMLKKQPEYFWETLQKTNILLVITKYDLNINYKNIENIAKKNNVKIFYENEAKPRTEFNRICINEEGTENIFLSYKNCYQGHNCPTLEDGILYKCPIIPGARHFNKYFNKNLKITEKDGINIYNDVEKRKIYEYLSSPSDFCRYCKKNLKKDKVIWSLSKRKLEEWT